MSRLLVCVAVALSGCAAHHWKLAGVGTLTNDPDRCLVVEIRDDGRVRIWPTINEACIAPTAEPLPVGWIE